jgi:acyl-CoA synthetase (AMP-forming)/AMP-acid ligase II
MGMEVIKNADSLVDVLRLRAEARPDQKAYTYLEDGEAREVNVTYAELERRARMVAGKIRQCTTKRECILICHPPGLDYISGFMGCLYSGSIAVPAYPPDPARLSRSLHRLMAILKDADIRTALTSSFVYDAIQTLFDREPKLRDLHWIISDKLEQPGQDDCASPAIDSTAVAFLQYTSGSTGAPKGVMVTHGNLLHNLDRIYSNFGGSSKSQGVIWLPPYHDMGLIGGILQPLYGGFPVVLMSPIAFLHHPVRWLSAITRYQATISGGPNFAYDLCVRKVTSEQIGTLDLSSWCVAFNGSERIHPETLEQFAHVFAPCGFRKEAFHPCYGLAETTLMATGGRELVAPTIRSLRIPDVKKDTRDQKQPVVADTNKVLVGCGQGMKDQKIVIADVSTLTKCPDNQIGEIWLSSPSVAKGYWGKEKETEAVFNAYLKDTGEGPFLRSGDLGLLREGELFVTGRLKDLIVIHGQNYYPEDIEQSLANSHPSLRPGCTAACATSINGEDRLLIVQEVRPQHTNVDWSKVVDCICKTVGKFHGLRVYAVALVAPHSIPKTTSGKIERYACRDSFLSGTLNILSEWRRKGGMVHDSQAT